MESIMKLDGQTKEKRSRSAGKKNIPDPFQELEDLALQVRGVSSGARALLENLLANRQEDYEIAAALDRNDVEKQKLAKAALDALLNVRVARVSPDET
jgi:hypothetical protein